MELRQLQTFAAVAEKLSFTRAADALGYAQSSVTSQIQALEGELGARLFERLGRRVELTDAGQRLKAYASRMLALEAELRQAVPGGGAAVGTLRIGAPESLTTYRLPALLAKLRRAHPGVRVVFQPDSHSELPQMVTDGLLDAAFFLNPAPKDRPLVIERLRDEPIRLVASPDHPLAAARGVRPADLVGETILHTESTCAYRQLFDRTLAEAGVRPEVAMEFASVEAIKQCTMAGLGIAVLPEVAVAGEAALGDLVVLDWAPEGFRVPLQLTWHKDRWLSPALTAFLALARETMAEGAPA